MTNDEVKDDLIELEHCNLVCLVSDDDDDDDDDGVEDNLIELEHCNLVCLVSDLAGDEKESWPQPECQLVGSWTLFIAIIDDEDHL